MTTHVFAFPKNMTFLLRIKIKCLISISVSFKTIKYIPAITCLYMYVFDYFSTVHFHSLT